jgi:hypothetical protein
MGAADTISRITSLGPRWPGMRGERKAAELIAAKLRAEGREVEVEPIRVRTAWPLAYMLHTAIAVVGNVVSVYVPPLGVALLLLAAVSMYGDLTARFYVLRRLVPRRDSQNVTARGPRPEAPARIVVTAHHDVARSGIIFNRRRRPPRRIVRRLGTLASRIDVVFWIVIVSLALALARLFAGFEASEARPLTIAQFACTAVLLTAFTLFVDVALSDPIPGANDNASGVAALLELGRRLDARPPRDLDVWLVSPGAKEALMLGMREWMRAHADELDPRRTFFLNLDCIGRGSPRIVGAEGFVIIYRHDPRLVDLATAHAGNELEREPYTWRIGTDGTIPAMHGFSSLTICCTDEYGRVPDFHGQGDTADKVDPGSIDRTVEIAEALIGEIDSKLVPSQLPSLRAGSEGVL